MKSINLACIALLVSVTLFSQSVSASGVSEKVYSFVTGTVSFFTSLTLNTVETILAIISLALCVKAAPRIIQGVFLQMHKDFDQAAIPIYIVSGTIIASMPFFIAHRNKETFKELLVRHHRHIFATIQGLVTITTLFLCEERFEVSKMEAAANINYPQWRCFAYIGAFVLSVLASHYVFAKIRTVTHYYFVVASISNAICLAFVLLKFDKNWKPSLDEAYKADQEDIEKLYSQASVVAGQVRDKASVVAGQVGANVADRYNSYIAPKKVTVPPTTSEPLVNIKEEEAKAATKLQAEKDEAESLAKRREAAKEKAATASVATKNDA